MAHTRDDGTLAVGLAVCVVTHNDAILPVLYAYYLLLIIGIILYMVRETRRYGRWLRNNYADLEHKEVWQSFIVLTIMMLVFGIYVFGVKGMTYHYVVQVNDIVLICYLLWRVETLSDLSIPKTLNQPADETATEDMEDSKRLEVELQLGLSKDIEPLLRQFCIDTQLYLQHDLSLSQLAKAIGTNRFYLSQYFSSQGLSYNNYINDLRINHFINLYREAVASQRSVTAQQLSQESGYRSYTTFSTAFKYKMGQSARSWMKSASEREQSQAWPEGKS